jgi:hypothetical protein
MLQNRIDPWGRLNAVPDRGALMGNRGILHDDQKRIVRPWVHKAWVTCLLSFKDIRREEVFTPGNYSELFFLDEATAFAAGHRPCFYCQRERGLQFRAEWLAANVAAALHADCKMPAMDAQLHAERTAGRGLKQTYPEVLAALPVGTLFEHAGSAWLLAPDGCRPWSFGGYGDAAALPDTTEVAVLTPRSIVAAFRHGFTPHIHPSAGT